MSDQDSTQVVKQAYEAFLRGDMQALLNSMSDDVVWETPVISAATFGGRREGKDGVAGFFSELVAAEEMLLFEPQEFIAQGNRVVVLGRYQGRVRSTGGIADTVFVQIFTVQDGKITDFLEIYDTANAERAYQRAASAA